MLDALLHRPPEVLSKHFKEYSAALADARLDGLASDALNAGVLRERILSCPAGREHFKQFEELGTSALSFLLGEEVGPPKPQSSTADDRQRRDVLFRNNRRSRFMQRLADRCNSDFLIVDFKNYTAKIGESEITEVRKYANMAIGRLVLVVARRGGNEAAQAAQHRCLRDDDVLVLILSDEHLLEMLAHKSRGQEPIDVIEDIYDIFLRLY